MKQAKNVRHARRERAVKKNLRCTVDDDVIELRALDRLEDAALREHVDTCPECCSRVSEYRAVVAGLKQALQDLEERQESKSPKSRSALARKTRIQ